MQIQKSLTPLSERGLVIALRSGHVQATGMLPSEERLGVAWSQCALELARGASIWCNNLGNITASSSWRGDYYVLRVPPPDPPELRFRAHANAVDGAADYWQFLLTAPRFAAAMARFDAGDALGATVALGAQHYYLANVDAYSRASARLYAEYVSRGLGAAREHGAPPPNDIDGISEIDALNVIERRGEVA